MPRALNPFKRRFAGVDGAPAARHPTPKGMAIYWGAMYATLTEDGAITLKDISGLVVGRNKGSATKGTASTKAKAVQVTRKVNQVAEWLARQRIPPSAGLIQKDWKHVFKSGKPPSVATIKRHLVKRIPSKFLKP